MCVTFNYCFASNGTEEYMQINLNKSRLKNLDEYQGYCITPLSY